MPMSKRSWCVLWLMLGVPPWHGAHAACAAASGDNRLPLVELYTAEGCNECPAADRWMSQWADRVAGARPALLALHVDYWDEFGWPDRFGAALHSRRQEARVMLAGKRVVVTPQVMVGEHTLVDWRDARAFDALIARARARPAPVDLSMQGARTKGGVQVRFDARLRDAADASRQPLLWLALYQDGLNTPVKAGENRGLTLRHDRVVRTLLGPWRMQGGAHQGEARLPLPPATDTGPMGLVLFAESSLTGEGLQALELPLSACLPQ